MAEKTSEEKVVKKPRTTKKVAEEVSADAPVKKAPVKKTTTTAKKATTTTKKTTTTKAKTTTAKEEKVVAEKVDVQPYKIPVKANPKKEHSAIVLRYKNEIAPHLMKKFNYKSVMEIPHLEKIVLNMGVGDATSNSKLIDAAFEDLKMIAGQQPIITKAKKSIATFKVREGMPIGVKVTLRGDRMYDFLNKLINIALPRVRDFHGVSANAFDGRGNYTLGIKEQLTEEETKEIEACDFGMHLLIPTESVNRYIEKMGGIENINNNQPKIQYLAKLYGVPIEIMLIKLNYLTNLGGKSNEKIK